MKKLKKWNYNYSLLTILAVLVIVIEIASGGKLLKMKSIMNMASQMPELGLLSIGMFVVILTAGIDLSITYLASLAGVCAAFVLRWGNQQEMNLVLLFLLAFLTAFVVAMAGGILNGIVVAKIGVHPVLATIGSYTLFYGIANVLTSGSAVSGFPKEYRIIGKGEVLGFLPIPLLIFICAALLAYFLLDKTVWGRSVYMLGSNAKAAKYSGIDTLGVNFKVYLFSAFFAFIAAIVMTGRYSSAKSDLGSSYLLKSVAVAVLGGTNMAGGEGSLAGVVIAACIIQVIGTGVSMTRLSSYFTDVLIGIILLGVLLIKHSRRAR